MYDKKKKIYSAYIVNLMTNRNLSLFLKGILFSARAHPLSTDTNFYPHRMNLLCIQPRENVSERYHKMTQPMEWCVVLSVN